MTGIFNYIASFGMKMVVSILLLFISSLSVSAKDIHVIAALDTSKALVGDQVKLKLVAKVTESKQLVWPAYGDTIVSGLEILEHGKVDTVHGENVTTYTQTFLLSSFDSGYYVIPPILFVEFSDTSKRYETEPMLLEVTNLPVDTSLAIKDIKGPMEAPITFQEIAPYVFGGLVLIGLIWLVVYLLKRYKKKPRTVVEKKPNIPAHLLALRNLKDLEVKKLWQNNEVKDYYTELADIVRTYLEDRYGIIAMEQTTHETLIAFESYSVNDSLDKLRQMLVLGDMVKFAKAKPLASEHTMSLENAYAFVEITKADEREKLETVIDEPSLNQTNNG